MKTLAIFWPPAFESLTVNFMYIVKFQDLNSFATVQIIDMYKDYLTMENCKTIEKEIHNEFILRWRFLSFSLTFLLLPTEQQEIQEISKTEFKIAQQLHIDPKAPQVHDLMRYKQQKADELMEKLKVRYAAFLQAPSLYIEALEKFKTHKKPRYKNV